VSFDPQNPRGAPPAATPPPATARPPSYIPPQPVNRGPSRNVLLAIALAVALVLLAIVILLLNQSNTPSAPGASPARSSGGSAAPSVVGSPHSSSVPSPRATTEATPGPSFVVVVGPSPGTPEAELLAHVPEGLRASCTAQTAASSPPIYMATCTATAGGITVNYSEYASAEVMNSAYQEIFAPVQIDPNSGSCEDHSTWPAEGTYDVEDSPAGRRLCTDKPGTPTIYWTDDRLNILSQASGADATQLLEFWTNEAGPIP
jgi:hypothetical protein